MPFKAIAACLTLWSAAQAQAAEPPVRSLLEIRESLVVTQQWDLSCGAATLATLLRYQHGIPVDERAIAAALIDRPEYLANPFIIRARHGFSLLDMKRVAAKHGLAGHGYGQLTIDHLESLAPLIIKVDFHGFPHFVVYRGLRNGTVYLADPAFGQRTVSMRRFEKAWTSDRENGRVGFRIVDRNGDAAHDRLALADRDFR